MNKKCISLLLGTALVLPVFAQSNDAGQPVVHEQPEQNLEEQSLITVLTVDDAVALALKNNLTIKQSQMDLDLLEKKNKYSWNSVSPSLSLSGGASGGVDGTFENFSDNAQSSLSWNAGGSIMMSLSPSIATSIESAKLAYENGEISLEAAKRSIELSVRKTFYQLLYANENIEIQKRSLEAAKQTYESNKIKYNLGRLSEVNLLNSQYSYESKVPTIANLENTFNSNLDNFKVMLGAPLTQRIELTGSLEDAIKNINISDDIMNSSIENNSEIKALKMSIKSAENSLNATKYSAYGPSLSLSGGVNAGGSKARDWKPNLSFSYSASVKIPLDGYLPWSNGALSIESQEENLEKLNMNLENKETSLRITIRNNFNTIAQAKEQLALYEKNVDLVQKSYDMTQKAYNAGSADLLTLQNAENNLYTAKYNVQNQRYTIISAILDLENTLGLPFGSLTE